MRAVEKMKKKRRAKAKENCFGKSAAARVHGPKEMTLCKVTRCGAFSELPGFHLEVGTSWTVRIAMLKFQILMDKRKKKGAVISQTSDCSA
jgi:hypothetical protein